MMNNAYKLEPAEPHVHWHFRPRHPQSIEVNGHTFDDPLYGHHYNRDQRRTVDDKIFRIVLEKIRTSI